jgi:hypothetical protein
LIRPRSRLTFMASKHAGIVVNGGEADSSRMWPIPLRTHSFKPSMIWKRRSRGPVDLAKCIFDLSWKGSAMLRRVSRRQVMAAGAGALVLGAGSRARMIQPVAAAEAKVRMTMGLRATVQSIPWIGTEAGIFRKHGVLVEFPALEVGGLESAAGLIRGDWEFSQTGTVPVAAPARFRIPWASHPLFRGRARSV